MYVLVTITSNTKTPIKINKHENIALNLDKRHLCSIKHFEVFYYFYLKFSHKETQTN